MKIIKSAALVLLSATATLAFAPASLKAASKVSLSMANEDNCDDRRSFVSKVSLCLDFSSDNEMVCLRTSNNSLLTSCSN